MESAQKYTVVLYYNYTPISDPVGFMNDHRALCKRLGLKGRMIIATEGVNGTFEGTADAIDEYVRELLQIPGLEQTHIKLSEGTGNAFPKLSIKVRDEIVTTHFGPEINPRVRTGKYLQPEELHEWFARGEEFYIVDMRNDYEQRVGHFEGSIFSAVDVFSRLPDFLPQLQSLRGKRILTVCTGGVRCEKASAFLLANGFDDVYQLYGGQVSYMEKYPNENFKGKLYVFDGRMVMGFNTDSPEHEIVGRCEICQAVSERFINCANNDCHRQMISCTECGEKLHECCSAECQAVFTMSAPICVVR